MENINFGKNIEFFYAVEDPTQLVTLADKLGEIRGVVVAGRSNVGKSSFINRLFSQKIALSSKTPGKTRKINIFKFNLMTDDGAEEKPFYLFDLPGFGHARVSKEMQKNWGELMEGFFQFISPFPVVLLTLQDARHPNTEVDRFFQDFLKPYSLISYLLFNKIDKLKTQKERSELNKRVPEISKYYKNNKLFFFISSENGKGFKELSLAVKSEFANLLNV